MIVVHFYAGRSTFLCDMIKFKLEQLYCIRINPVLNILFGIMSVLAC